MEARNQYPTLGARGLCSISEGFVSKFASKLALLEKSRYGSELKGRPDCAYLKRIDSSQLLKDSQRPEPAFEVDNFISSLDYLAGNVD